MTPQAHYIGDSIYLKNNGNGWFLCTNNGLGNENIIYLEPEIIQLLCLMLRKILLPE